MTKTSEIKSVDGVCDLCLRPMDARLLHIGAETVRGEQMVVCDQCKGDDFFKCV